MNLFVTKLSERRFLQLLSSPIHEIKTCSTIYSPPTIELT